MKELKDIFVSYEIAVQLKEMGFEEPCIAVYSKGKLNIFDPNDSVQWVVFEGDFFAPTWEQVFKWFREKDLESSLFTEDGYYYYRGSKGDKFLFSGTESSYEQAREQLIYKLIEIYKNEQDI
ncbi:hypothetical protein CAPN008_21800 [Capnocytophaga canis]|uniref:hypothetical protein n=1 Tax=Capnocytophaga canis TaxID=1848903 RepID=UPI001AC4C120|nr:hypothetical protein [Capnocytophaga canis]GIM62130.1 hypothetical protein CAPN008_21800 [Capnocytophaga canis]